MLLEGTFGHYIWRASTFGGKAYLCGRRKANFDVGPRGEGKTVESLMLESDDGFIWRKRSVFQEVQGDETAFHFQPDGSIVAIGRRGNANAQLLRSKPPYQEWMRQDLDRYIGGPLIARWGERVVVGGRKSLAGIVTSVFGSCPRLYEDLQKAAAVLIATVEKSFAPKKVTVVAARDLSYHGGVSRGACCKSANLTRSGPARASGCALPPRPGQTGESLAP